MEPPYPNGLPAQRKYRQREGIEQRAEIGHMFPAVVQYHHYEYSDGHRDKVHEAFQEQPAGCQSAHALKHTHIPVKNGQAKSQQEKEAIYHGIGGIAVIKIMPFWEGPGHDIEAIGANAGGSDKKKRDDNDGGQQRFFYGKHILRH
jgi:hypothetical protein